MVSPEQYTTIDRSSLQLKKYEQPMWPGDPYERQKPATTPSEWFSQLFPEQAKIYGCPFIELTQESMEGLTKVNPLAMNVDFFAAILGGDKKLGHKVVYIEGELEFYFFDPRTKIFKTVSQEKLQNQLRAYLIRCAEELPDTSHKLNLFLEFRSDKQTRAVVHRAKSILAADETFFSRESNNERKRGAEVYDRVARVFVEQILSRDPGQVLTLTNAYLVFLDYLKRKELPPIKRSTFKGIFSSLVRDAFDLGLRNDVIDQVSNRQTAGWKGLRAQSAGI